MPRIVIVIDACFGFDTVSFVPARSPIEIIQGSPRYKVYRVCTSCWPIILNISWRVVMFDLFFFPEIHSRNSWKRAFLNVRFITMIRERWGRGLILKDDQIVEWGIFFFEAETFNISFERYWMYVDIFFFFFNSTITRNKRKYDDDVTQFIVTLSEKLYYILERRYNFWRNKNLSINRDILFSLLNISLAFGVKMNGTKYRTLVYPLVRRRPVVFRSTSIRRHRK